MFSRKKATATDSKPNSIASVESDKSTQVPLPTPQEQSEKDSDAHRGVDLFFNNELDEALALFGPKASTDPLYSLSTLTFNEEDIKKSIADLDKTYELAQADIDLARPQTSILGSVTKLWSSGFGFLNRSTSTDSTSNGSVDSQSGSEEKEPRMQNLEFRGHVVKAESLLLSALVQFFQESILNYMKAGLNLRKGYLEYQTVHTEMRKLDPSGLSDLYDNDSVGGAHFGIGTTNVVLSILPTKILKIIAVLGIKGDRELGFDYLQRAIKGNGVRSPLARLFVIMFHSLLLSFAPTFYLGSINELKELLDESLSKYPASSFFQLSSGRYLRAQRLLPESIEAFQKAAVCPPSWPEFASFSYYEVGLTQLFLLDWRSAITEFIKLVDLNYWSKALFIYLQAACHVHLNESDKADELLAQVEGAMLRKFGGRTISVEQFVLRKAKTHLKDPENGRLILPGLEIIAIWNGFACMSPETLNNAKRMVQDAIALVKEKESNEATDQKLCLLYFIQGAILKEILTEHKEAKESFQWIFDHPKHVGEDTYLIPFAHYEAGVLAYGENEIDICRQHLEKARDYNTDFNFEYRLAMRIHLALMKLDDDHRPSHSPTA